jgi:hypothetical protein
MSRLDDLTRRLERMEAKVYEECDGLVYAIVNGEYDDFDIHCIFEREEDAKKYLAAQGYEEKIIVSSFNGPRLRWCEPDVPASWGDFRIVPLQFWPAGVIPHAKLSASR